MNATLTDIARTRGWISELHLMAVRLAKLEPSVQLDEVRDILDEMQSRVRYLYGRISDTSGVSRYERSGNPGLELLNYRLSLAVAIMEQAEMLSGEPRRSKIGSLLSIDILGSVIATRFHCLGHSS